MVYWSIVSRMTPEARVNFDRLLDQLDEPAEVRELRDPNAPDWWHGEEEAYESSMAAVSQLSMKPGGRRG